MLICLDNVHFSIVAHYAEAESLLVRAKHNGDINQLWPDATVDNDEGVDFTERAIIPRYKVAGVLSELILSNLDPNVSSHTLRSRSSYIIKNNLSAAAQLQ